MTRDEFYREADPDSRGPLSGYRVLEVTQAVAGPVVGTCSRTWAPTCCAASCPARAT